MSYQLTNKTVIS